MAKARAVHRFVHVYHAFDVHKTTPLRTVVWCLTARSRVPEGWVGSYDGKDVTCKRCIAQGGQH